VKSIFKLFFARGKEAQEKLMFSWPLGNGLLAVSAEQPSKARIGIELSLSTNLVFFLLQLQQFRRQAHDLRVEGHQLLKESRRSFGSK